MAQSFKSVYQFKITLLDLGFKVWRLIQVPESYSFWDLHVAIQDAMGWENAHLHCFEFKGKGRKMSEPIGLPGDDGSLDGTKIKLSDYFLDNSKAIYIYDFGDDWQHEVVLEKVLPRDPKTKYPICLDGKYACPPEDCGGAPGYMMMLEALKDPTSEDYDEYIDWLGEGFDPEEFDCQKVRFRDPNRVPRGMFF